jgi:hypothetical protein
MKINPIPPSKMKIPKIRLKFISTRPLNLIIFLLTQLCIFFVLFDMISCMISNLNKIELLFGNCMPISIAPSGRNQFLNREDQAKYERIRSLIVEVGEKIGIADPQSIHFLITTQLQQNACMVGSTIALGRPVMCLSNDYFTHFESPSILNDPLYQSWKACVANLPDDPIEIGKALASCPSDMRRAIYDMSKKFKSVITREELQGVVAHEFGHAKHLHNWKKLFFLFSIPAAVILIAHRAFSKQQEIGILASLFALSIGMNQVSQIFEKEADEETSASRAYNAGLKLFFKKIVIAELSSPSILDPERTAKKRVEQFDFGTHPHPAKRVLAAMRRKETPAQPISAFEKGIALFGGILLVNEFVPIIQTVCCFFFPQTSSQKQSSAQSPSIG